MPFLIDLRKFSKKALVIAAHPDDESLFMGGTIAEFKRWRWTVLCVTDCDKRYSKQRRWELLRACRIYNGSGSNVTPVMLGAVKQKGRFLKRKVAQKIKDFIDEFGPFEVIFTHSDKGDYGHKTHRLIHNVVKEMELRNVYNFSSPFSRRIQTIKLSPESHRTKMRAINVYLNGSQKTNLSRLKKPLSYILNIKTESFNKVN